MTVNSSVNCVILIVFALSDNLSAENSSCLRSSATAKTTFLDVWFYTVQYCTIFLKKIFLKITQYCTILNNIAQYFSILQNTITKYFSMLHCTALQSSYHLQHFQCSNFIFGNETLNRPKCNYCSQTLS